MTEEKNEPKVTPASEEAEESRPSVDTAADGEKTDQAQTADEAEKAPEKESAEDAEETEDKEEKEGKAEKGKSEGKYKKENKLLTAQLKIIESQLMELRNSYLALYAEYENYRKRTAKEKEAILTDATASCLTAILPVIDNLERALTFAEGDKVVEGVRMTMNAFREVMTKLGVEEIETKTFDPACHNAVMHVEDESRGEGEIVDVFQKGYKKGDKILRVAMVKVAN